MLINKRAILILSIASVLCIIWSLVSFFIKNQILLLWNQGVAFGVLGSSLVSLFCSIINYFTEKKKCIESVGYKLAHMSNDAYTQFYNSNSYTLEQVAATIGSCTKSCFEIQSLLREYFDGLLPFSKEKQKIEEIGLYVQRRYQYELFALGSLLKENKEIAEKNINHIVEKLYLLLNDNEAFEKLNVILKKNKSIINLEVVKENEVIQAYKNIIISGFNQKEE